MREYRECILLVTAILNEASLLCVGKKAIR